MIIGLTGGIGCGKSAAGIEFEKLGITVIDADAISLNVTSKDSPAYKRIVSEFGTSILDELLNINRKKLRDIVFNDEDKKNILEAIIHPEIRKDMNDAILNSSSAYTVIMVPLIYETNSKNNYNKILVVDCDEDLQITRASKRDGVTKEDIVKIINLQASRQDRLSIADDVINNNSSLDALKDQVLDLHNKYLEITNG
jgi:dephospho-CoA kinase